MRQAWSKTLTSSHCTFALKRCQNEVPRNIVCPESAGHATSRSQSERHPEQVNTERQHSATFAMLKAVPQTPRWLNGEEHALRLGGGSQSICTRDRPQDTFDQTFVRGASIEPFNVLPSAKISARFFSRVLIGKGPPRRGLHNRQGLQIGIKGCSGDLCSRSRQHFRYVNKQCTGRWESCGIKQVNETKAWP